MDVSANFAFLEKQFPHAAVSASYAEKHVYGDPRAACFHARHALERLVARVFKIDKALSPPKVTNLSGYLSEPSFRALVPQAVWLKAELIREAGNVAVHGKKMPSSERALALVRELAHVLYWAGRTYLKGGAETLRGQIYDEALIPKVAPTAAPVSLDALDAFRAKLDASAEAHKELESELEALRERLAEIKAENEAVPDTHGWDEAKTRRLLIDLALQRAGWALERKEDREYEVTGMPNSKGVGYVDYVLWGDDGKPLGVVEAKKTMVDAKKGRQQAKLYADCLETMTGQRPIIFYTNGYDTFLWDDQAYPPRPVAGFYEKSELASLIVRRTQRQPVDGKQIADEIAGRYYQKRAIGSIGERLTQSHRRALLVMATGTGKTRVSIALVDLLQRAGWVKRALFLADRVSLVNQAVSAYKKHLPESSPVNLVTEKDKSGRVYVCTYPTMMGLIDETKDGQARFGVGHFDLVIIDEAHRSVYQKYGAIFRYFDSLLVGLTATPSDQVDKNTYDLFGLPQGVPTDAYELETAVADGFLVPPRVQQVDLKFPSKGIHYDQLPEEEKAHWEGLDWGDEAVVNGVPTEVSGSAVNSWLFNRDTVDKVLRHLMEHGHRVDGGDRLAKTIVFARNHDHAEFIAERFDHHYPHMRGHFARVIDHQATYPQSLIDDFSQRDKAPHIAISVDMLDTGIDVPEVANLVFFKPVYSKIKFWQMIGRGTRLCPHLFGPEQHKEDFRVFDFCGNFDFFDEKPEGIESSAALPLGTRLFRSRVDLLAHLQETPDEDPEGALAESLTDTLHGEVACMNPENFIVRMQLEAVNRFRDRGAWKKLSHEDWDQLHHRVAGLPSEQEADEIESRMFDLSALRMQLALAEGDLGVFERLRERVVEIAAKLEEKKNIPAVKAQLAYLAAMQEATFWEGIDLHLLEDMRLRLRGLVPFLDKKERVIVYTDLTDEVTGTREWKAAYMPRMTGVEYEKKVKAFLDNHLDHLVIHRLRTAQPLTRADLEGLERTLAEIGEEEGETLLSHLLAKSEAPSLAHFVRRMVGMDREAAHAAFSQFLKDESLSPPQIRFVEMLIEQLTARGFMEASALYESPFSDLHGGGPDALFAGKKNVIEGIFEKLEAVSSSLSSEAS